MLVRSIMNDKQTQGIRLHEGMQLRDRAASASAASASARSCSRATSAAWCARSTPRFRRSRTSSCRRCSRTSSMTKRGLVIVVGGTGSGKSTSLAAMVNYRNENTRGHIITIEDPVEYVHHHKGCVDHAPRSRRRHRELAQGAEEHAAPGAGRDPDRRNPRPRHDGVRHPVRRDRPPVLATLHANSANQALDRIINFFPEERRDQLLMDLSLNITRDDLAAPDPARERHRAYRGDGDHAELAADHRPDLQGRSRHDQGSHGEVQPPRHADLRPGAVRAVRGRR